MDEATIKLKGDGSARNTFATVVTPSGEELRLPTMGYSINAECGTNEPGSVTLRLPLALCHLSIEDHHYV